MTDEPPKPSVPPLDLHLYTVVGNICSDWATLEYLVNDCIWGAAKVDEALGACITVKIFSLQSKLEALVLLLRERDASAKLQSDFNSFIQDSRRPSEARNRAAHDPMGVNETTNKPQQLQITGQGKLVFQLRDVDPLKLIQERDEISAFLTRFMALRQRIKTELETSPYTPRQLFPGIRRGP